MFDYKRSLDKLADGTSTGATEAEAAIAALQDDPVSGEP